MSGLKAAAPNLNTASEMTDLLIAVAKQRDKAAFTKVFDHYAPRIKSYLISRGTNDAAAEELSQEAMTSVWRKADKFDPSKAGAGTWIFTLARNLSIDAFRKERRPEFDPDDPTLIPDPEPEPDASVASKEGQQLIKKALAGLPTEQRDVIHLSFFQDKSQREIAEELEIPLGTVKSRVRLAMGRIREALKEEISSPNLAIG